MFVSVSKSSLPFKRYVWQPHPMSSRITPFDELKHHIPFDLSAPSRHTKLLFSAVYPLVYSTREDSDGL